MKTVVAVLVALTFGLSTFAQDTTQVKAKPKVTVSPYVAAGLSISTGDDFTNGSFASVEAGIMIQNLAIGFMFGANNLNAFGDIKTYNYEFKAAYYVPVKFIDIYGVIGIGSYTGKPTYVFLEYGGGVAKSFNNGLGVFVQATSWDKTVYVTPGLSYSF